MLNKWWPEMRNQTELGAQRTDPAGRGEEHGLLHQPVYLQTESGDVTSQPSHLLITTSLTLIKQNILVKRKEMRNDAFHGGGGHLSSLHPQPMKYQLPPQALPLSPGVSGRYKAGGWRERQTQAPQVLTKKCTDCEITPGLDNLPPCMNPWGTEIINLLISYTLLFPFSPEKQKMQIAFLCQSVSQSETNNAF